MKDPCAPFTSRSAYHELRPRVIHTDDDLEIERYLAEEEDWPDDERPAPDRWQSHVPSWIPLAEISERELLRLGVERLPPEPLVYPKFSVRANLNGLKIKLANGTVRYTHWRHFWKPARYNALLPILKEVGVTVDLIPASRRRILVRSTPHPILFVYNATQRIQDRYSEFQLVFDTRTRYLVESCVSAEFFGERPFAEELD